MFVDTNREKDLPILKFCTIDLSNTVSNQAPDALLEAVHGIEGTDYERLFISSIPHRRPFI